MYNEQVKERFIDVSALEDKKPLEVLFEKTEEFEKDKGKDLYDFNKKDLIEFFRFQATNSMQQLIMLSSRIRTYIRFALNENLVKDGQDHISEIDYDTLISCLCEKKIYTREEILHRINLIANDMDKFIILAVFEGIVGKDYEDLAHLKLSDFYNGEVHIKDKHFKVSEELISLAKTTDEQEEYVDIRDRKYKYDLSEKYIIKSFVNRKLGLRRRGKRIYQKFYNNIREEMRLPSTIALKDIYLSGMIDQISTAAKKESKKIEEIMYDKKIIEEIEYRYFKIQSRKNFLKRYF